jgi:NADPH:quinone reductase
MKSIRVERHGGPEVLELTEVAPIGEPGPGQAVVSIRAAGVNFMDIAQRRGDYPRDVPFTPSVEGAGVVSAVGADVHNVRVSDPLTSNWNPDCVTV